MEICQNNYQIVNILFKIYCYNEIIYYKMLLITLFVVETESFLKFFLHSFIIFFNDEFSGQCNEFFELQATRFCATITLIINFKNYEFNKPKKGELFIWIFIANSNGRIFFLARFANILCMVRVKSLNFKSSFSNNL